MAKALPIHPQTGLRAIYVSEKTGRAFWPIIGGSEPAGDPPQDPPPTTTEPPPLADPGFPLNTPLEQMSTEQREAYWKDKARKHEDRVKAFGKLTPDELNSLREKAEKHDALEYELASDRDKAVADAAANSRLEVYSELVPRLVQAEFKIAAAGRIEADKLATILEPLDLSKFLADDGEPDTAKVQAYVDGIAPATGNQQQQRKQGPSSNGMGYRGNSTPGAGSVAAGRDLYAETHPKK